MKSVAQNALSTIQRNYAAALHDLKQLSTLEKQIETDHDNIAWWEAHEHYKTSHYSVGALSEVTDTHTHWTMENDINIANTQIAKDQASVSALESKIEGFCGSTGDTLHDLFGALNGLNAGTSVQAHSLGECVLSGKTEASTMKELLSMIRNQIQIDVLEEEGGGCDDLKAMQLESENSDDFQALSAVLDSALTEFETEKYHYLDEKTKSDSFLHQVKGYIKGPYTGNSQPMKEQEIENKFDAARRQIAAILSAQSDLTKVGSDMIDKSFQSILFSIQSLEGRMQSILADPKLSTSEKAAKLATVVQFLLGFLQDLIQVAENLRSKSKAKMAKATIQAQKLNLHNMAEDAKILAQVKKQQKEMGAISKVLKVVVFAISALMIATGTVGVAIAMLAVTVASDTGALSKWTNDLGKALGSKIAGDALMMGLTAVATMGAGVSVDLAIEGLSSVVATQLTEDVVEASKATIKDATDNTIETLKEKLASQVQEEMASQVQEEMVSQVQEEMVSDPLEMQVEEVEKVSPSLESPLTLLQKTGALTKSEQIVINRFEDVVQNAREEVMAIFEKTARQAAKRAVQGVLKATYDGAVYSLKNLGMKGVQNAISVAVEDAVTKSIENGAQLAEKAALEGVESVTAREVDAAAVKSANSAVRQAMKVDPELKARPENLKERLTRIRKSRNFSAGMWAGTYMTASTDFLQNIAEACLTKNEKDKQKVQEWMQFAFTVLQAIMQTVAMVKGSEMSTRILNNPSLAGSLMTKGAAITMTGSMFAEGYVDYSMGKIGLTKSNAQKKLMETQALEQLEKTLRAQDDQETRGMTEGFIQEINQLNKEQVYLAEHFWEGLNAGCQVLAARSV